MAPSAAKLNTNSSSDGAGVGLLKALFGLQNDNNVKVRYQLLCTLGDVNGPEAEQVRQKLLFKDINDKWVQIAALTAASSQSGSLLTYVLKNFKG